MENPHKFMVTHLIAPILYRYFFKKFKIKQTPHGVSVLWDKDGLLYSCNSSTNIEKYVCEVSYIDKNNALCRYSDLVPIYYLEHPDQMVDEFYRAFLRYNILRYIFNVRFAFDIKNLCEKKRKNPSLFIRSFYQLSTEELSRYHYFFRII